MEYLDCSPVRDYEIETPIERSYPITLSFNEVKQIEEAILNHRLDRVRSLFLLQCYTGLSYSDIPRFLNDEIRTVEVGGKMYLIGERVKTGIEFNVPLSEKALNKMLKVKNIDSSEISNQNYNNTINI